MSVFVRDAALAAARLSPIRQVNWVLLLGCAVMLTTTATGVHDLFDAAPRVYEPLRALAPASAWAAIAWTLLAVASAAWLRPTLALVTLPLSVAWWMVLSTAFVIGERSMTWILTLGYAYLVARESRSVYKTSGCGGRECETTSQ